MAGDWVKEHAAAVTVCDTQGIILEMNDRARLTFAKDGGGELVGRNVLDCHPPEARRKLAEMLASQTANCYTIEKNGRKKLVYQAPWYEGGEYRGFVEMVLELPAEMPHFIRG